MPGKSRHRKPRRRKRRRKRIIFDKILPQTKTVKLRYVQELQLNPSIGTGLAFSNFSCNGLFDPYQSGGGHQPMLFDQIMPLYDHYRVISSTCRLTPIPLTGLSSDITPGYFGVMLNDDGIMLYNTAAQIIESGLGKTSWNVYGPYQSNPKGRSVSKSFNSARIFGKTRALGADELLGNDGANPLEGYSFTCWAGSVNTTNDPTIFTFLIELEYIAQFTEPKEVAQS